MGFYAPLTQFVPFIRKGNVIKNSLYQYVNIPMYVQPEILFIFRCQCFEIISLLVILTILVK